MRETQVQSLGQEDPLEKDSTTHTSTLAWRIPWREEPGRLQSVGSQRVGHDWATSLHFCLETKDVALVQMKKWLNIVFLTLIPLLLNNCKITPIKSFFPLTHCDPCQRLPTMQETLVQSLGWEDPLEKEMATHSSTLAWRIPWREEPGRLQSMGSQRVGHDWATSLSLSLSQGCTGMRGYGGRELHEGQHN